MSDPKVDLNLSDDGPAEWNSEGKDLFLRY